MQVWRKSIHWFKRYSTYKTMTLKMRCRSPKLICSLACHIDVSTQVWRRSIHWFKGYRGYKNLSSKSSGDLESEVKVKHQKLLSLSQWYIEANMVDFHQLVQEISWVQESVKPTPTPSPTQTPTPIESALKPIWHNYLKRFWCYWADTSIW